MLMFWAFSGLFAKPRAYSCQTREGLGLAYPITLTATLHLSQNVAPFLGNKITRITFRLIEGLYFLNVNVHFEPVR